MHLTAARQAGSAGRARRGAARVPAGASEYDPRTGSSPPRSSSSSGRSATGSRRSRPKPPMQRDARARARRCRRSRAQPGVARAARHPVHQREPPRHPELHRRATGINITFASDYRDPAAYTVQLDGVTLEQALKQILSANQLFYKVLNERTILVFPDNAQKRAQYEEQVVRTSTCRTPTRPSWRSCSTRSSACPASPSARRSRRTRRATRSPSAPPRRWSRSSSGSIEANDKPRAEVVIDV